MNFLRHITCFALMFVLLSLSGCASPPALRERYFWPPPPDPARIEWITVYHSQLDLEKTSFRRLKEALVGEDAPIALSKPAEARIDDAHNKLYVADIEAAAVFVFDITQSDLRMLPLHEAKLSGRLKPIGLALDRDKNLFVLEPNHRKILVFNHLEKYVRTIDLAEICKRPVALAIDKKQQRVYVSDAELSVILALDFNGALLHTIGGPGDSAGRLNRPVGMVVNSAGELLVADAFNARIQKFDNQGRYIKSFGNRGTGIGDFQLIKSVAVDPDNNVYVADGRSNSIKIFNKNGELLLVFGGYYAVSSSGKLAPGGFALPMSIDIDDNGRMYIVDQLNARIQVFQYIAP